MSITRRPRWHPPPPPTPRILHLPRRSRRKATKQIAGKSILGKKSESERNQRGKLETLFDQERVFSHTVPIVLLNSGDCERRERVEDFEYGGNSAEALEEEKWRFQAEILRAECNFLRMERDIALKKLELNRVQTKRTLRSAVETLISGKKKIYEGKSADAVLEEEIEGLEEELKQLQRCSGVSDFEVRKCSNFDKQASLLQRRLEKLGEGLYQEKCVKEIREMAEASLTIKTSCKSFVSDQERRFTDVEILRRKMERLSKGMLERIEEEYGSMLSSASASANSSASTSRRIEFPRSSSSVLLQLNYPQEIVSREEKACSGRCKVIVRKIVEQVRAEMEQWSQMQDMLGRVREEMEELQVSRDFWEDRAIDSDDRFQSLESSVQEWRQKALSSETKVTELQKQISDLQIEVGRLRSERKLESGRTKSIPSIPQGSQKEKEKRVLICSLKENHQRDGNGNKHSKDWDDGWRRRHSCVASKRSPLRELGNSSLQLFQQNSRAVYPLHSPEIFHSNENI